MKLAFVCSGEPDGLKFLKINKLKVVDTLKNHGWEAIPFILKDLTYLNDQLQEYKEETIDEFIFFYTGHGDTSNRRTVLKLQLYGNKQDINNIIDEIIEYLNPNKTAIILDACYSGNFEDVKFEYNMEFLFSSKKFEESHEDLNNKFNSSIFSNYFCKALVNSAGEITLDVIKDYINLNTDKQHSQHISLDSKIVIADKTLNIIKPFNIQKNIILDRFMKSYKEIDIAQIIEVAKKFITSPLYLNKISDSTPLEAINILYDTVGYKVLNDILNELENNPPKKISEEKLLSDKKENHIYIHFRQDDLVNMKYEFDIYARYSGGKGNKTLQGLIIEDINDLNEQEKLLIELKKVRKKFPLHLIIPAELYLTNFRMWKKQDRQLIDLFNPIYIHSSDILEESLDAYEWMIEEWDEEFLPDKLLFETLQPLEKKGDKIKATDNKIGVCFKYKPTNTQEIEEHLDLAKIALLKLLDTSWIDDNYTKLTLKELPKKLYECKNISLLWDEASMLLPLKQELKD